MRSRNRRRKSKQNNRLALIGMIGLVLVTSLITGFLVRVKQNREAEYTRRVLADCETLETELQNNQLDNLNIANKGRLQSSSSSLTVNTNNHKAEKYQLKPLENSQLTYNTDDSVQVCVYDNQSRLVEDNNLQSSLLYSLFIISNQEQETNYNININLETRPSQLSADFNDNSDPIPINEQTDTISETSYNVKTRPNLENSQNLQRIINQVLKFSQNSNFPTQDDISITLIDLNNNTIAQHQGYTPRYPASVAKLFWLVTFYSYLEEEDITLNSDRSQLIEEMISQSDNEASSKLIDLMTNTQSGSPESANFNSWYEKRQQLNRFFQEAKYSDKLNISQKTYPIPYLEEYGKRPKGLELKMRHLGNNNENNPIRNKLNTYDSARLMYEIVNEKAISPDYSQKMQNHLERDLTPEAWRNIDPNFEFNPIRAFFGEGLPQNVRFLSKAGWTSSTRQEVAYIETPDQKTRYILAIFAENEAYAQNWEIFPKLSRFVFQEMSQ